MQASRSKPLLIAPLIPLWAVLGFFAVSSLQGGPYLLVFLILWGLLLAVLFGYVLRQVLAARRSQRARRFSMRR